jgi:hypothetical protein
MNSRELGELILVELYKLAEREGHGQPKSLLQIAKKFGESDVHKVYNMLKVLDGRGLVRDANVAGDIMGYITGEGTMLVEGGGETGIISRYEASPASFIIDQSTKIYGDVHGSQVTTHSQVGSQKLRTSSEASALVLQIIARLAADESLGEQRVEIMADAEQLKRELGRKEQRWPIVQSLLSSLSDVSSVSSLALQLGAMLGIGG